MQVALIGPSGVGKTFLAKYAENSLGLKHINLDRIFDYRGTKIAWGKFKATVDASLLEDNVLLDIGTGFHKYSKLPLYLQGLGIPIILIYSNPKASVARTPLGKNRLISEYIDTDYTKNNRVFKIATEKLDVSRLSKKSAEQAFIKLLSGQLGTELSETA